MPRKVHLSDSIVSLVVVVVVVGAGVALAGHVAFGVVLHSLSFDAEQLKPSLISLLVFPIQLPLTTLHTAAEAHADESLGEQYVVK
jgi:hypothetical protein